MAAGGSFDNFVRILDAESGVARGCGVLISPRHVLTTTMAWGYLGREDYRPSGFVAVPTVTGDKPLGGTVAAWYAADTKEHEADYALRDIAVIELEQPFPAEISYPPLLDPERSVEQEVRIFGHEEDLSTEALVTGHLRGAMPSGRVAFNIDGPIAPGRAFLGAPVVSPDGVLGIAVAADEKTITAISANRLQEAISRLQTEVAAEPQAEVATEPQAEEAAEPQPKMAAEPQPNMAAEPPPEEAAERQAEKVVEVEQEVPPPGSISTHATSDLWTIDDKLGYREYARAIHNFLQDSRTEPPLTISIQAPWGGGKTSLMRMVQMQLDPLGYARSSGATPRSLVDELKATTETILDELGRLTDRDPTDIELDGGKSDGESKCVSVWFNAWRYQSSDQIWAGLAEAVIRGITDRMEPVEREKFLLRLHIGRVDPGLIRAKVYDVVFRRFIGMVRWIVPIAFLGVLAAVGLLWNWWNVSSPWPVPAGLSAIVASALGVATAYFKARREVEAEPARINLSDFVDVPDYSGKLGFVHDVTEDLRRVFEILPTVTRDGEESRLPLVIFIDDLDRCAPPKVAEVFEAINLFVAGEFPNCYIIIGMDTEVVAAALEEAHKSVIGRLPSYARRVPVGWRFMDKFVQLPFVIPPLNDDAISDYAEYLAASEDLDARKVQARAAGDGVRKAEAFIKEALEEGQDDKDILEGAQKYFLVDNGGSPTKALDEGARLAERQVEAVKRLRFIDEQAKAFHSDSRKMQELLCGATEEFSNNPRELKRLANVYRFYYNLRLARQSQNQPIPTELQLQDWLKLSLAWPDVVRWLRRSGTELDASSDSGNGDETAAGYRLSRLEKLAVNPVEYLPGTGNKKPKTRPPGVEDWADALATEFSVPSDTAWLRDERLFSFLRKIANREAAEQLSAGSGKGFW